MKKIRFIWVVLLLLCLSACAKEKVSEQGTYGTEESTVDWRGQEFQVQENVANNQTIWMDKFNLIDISDMVSSDESVFMSIYLGQFGEKVYYLYELHNKESQNIRYACVSVNLTDMTRSVHSEFTMSDIGYMAPYYLVFGACMPEEGILMLDLEEGYYNADEELVRNRYWSYIEDKKIVKQIDMTSFVKDNDLFLDAGFIGNGENQVYLADDGCIYYLPMDKYYDVNFLYVFDGEGNLLNQYQKPQNSKFRSPIRTQDGDYLFPIYMNHEKRVDMVCYDNESNSVRKLGGIEDNGAMKLVVMHGSRIYYISENKVISWDVVTGDRTECCNLTDLGYYNNSSLLMLWCNAKPYIRFKDGSGEWIVSTSESEMVNDSAIEVADLLGDSRRLKAAITQAKMDNRNMSVSFADASGDTDKNRIYAEFAAGNGPDVMLVSRDEMFNMVDKGMLADMEDIIGLENKEKLIGSAVKVGMVGDVFYGVPQGIYMESVIVHEDSVKENTWTHEQFMDSVLAGDIYPCVKIGNSLCSSQISFKLITRLNLTDSFFIDWEKRQSRFASDDVKRFIETFGDYELTSIDDVDVDKKKTYQIGGVSSGNIHDEDSYQDYLEYLEKSGYKYIGYPTSQGNGNYLRDDGVIVVNVNTIHKEEVRELIEAILGDEVQSLKYIGDDYVSVTGYGIEDFIPYLEMCVPFPAENTVIQSIVFEELEPYFEHDKTLEQALKLIDSRVQIYLDETE